MPIAPGDAVVADANVLLSAAIGKAARRIFTRFQLRVHATEFNVLEVEEYLPELTEKYELSELLIQMRWRLLPVGVHSLDIYAEHFPWARQCLGDRDPDDAHPLALARTLDIPLWSNDRDLQGHGVTCYPTARLLRVLETSEDPHAR